MLTFTQLVCSGNSTPSLLDIGPNFDIPRGANEEGKAASSQKLLLLTHSPTVYCRGGWNHGMVSLAF